MRLPRTLANVLEAVQDQIPQLDVVFADAPTTCGRFLVALSTHFVSENCFRTLRVAAFAHLELEEPLHNLCDLEG